MRTLDSWLCTDIQQEIQLMGKSVGLGDVLGVSILSSKLSFSTFRFFKKKMFLFFISQRDNGLYHSEETSELLIPRFKYSSDRCILGTPVSKRLPFRRW